MAIRMVNCDPGEVRTHIQSRYDRYRQGTRMVLGMTIDGVSPETMGASEAERSEAYAKVSLAWPRKSKGLMTAVARDILFEQQCADNHAKHANGLFDVVEPQVDTGQQARVGYISGYGRNACLVSMLEVGTSESPVRLVPLVVRPHVAIALYAGLGAPEAKSVFMIDPDFGLGNVQGGTPELYGDIGSADLAQQACDQFADYLEVLHGAPQTVSIQSNLL